METSADARVQVQCIYIYIDIHTLIDNNCTVLFTVLYTMHVQIGYRPILDAMKTFALKGGQGVVDIEV